VISNSLLLRSAWLAASLVLCGRIAWASLRTGRPPIQWAERPAVSWPAVPVCATFLAALLAPWYFMYYVVQFGGQLEQVALLQWNCVARFAQMGLIAGLLAAAGPLRRQDFGCDFSDWKRDAAVGLKGFVASALPVFGTMLLLLLFQLRAPEDKHVLLQAIEKGAGPSLLAWIAFSVILIAPLSEELTYRVLLQGWLETQLRPWQAIVIAAGVFVVQHQEFDRLPLVPLALILGYVYYRRHSYLSVVLLHALFNGANLWLALIAK
jgi:membrane protease YdiL (CAAX protease family)